MSKQIKIKIWIIFKRFGTNQIPYILNASKLDISDEELALCVEEQYYGDLK